ncbi:hypothetical protein P692DRAFT_20839801 [Suillus brevipes Sb2]|nr:hypothetical protein P692DRAFT_20839801 [Suillus brevipes Sb2]
MSYIPQTDLWLERSRLDGMMLGAVSRLDVPTGRKLKFHCLDSRGDGRGVSVGRELTKQTALIEG